MKTILYTLILLTSFGSCRKLEKMVERGEYNRAIVYATKKLAGKKKKKTKHVKALEEAFVKITKRDTERIAYLNGNQNPENWDIILRLAEDMEYRQERIRPFLPLVSKDGYEAHFDMVDTYKIRTEAIAGAARFHYENGIETLDLAKKEDDHYLAREAYGIFGQVENYKRGFEKVNELRREAQELGVIHISVDVLNEIQHLVPANLSDNILTMDLSRANDLWRRFHIGKSEVDMDYQAVLELDGMELSPERETITHHIDEKEVKDGWEYVRDNEGQFVVDTSGNRIRVDKYKTLRADVTQVHRRKWAAVSGYMRLIDVKTNGLKSSKNLQVEAVFDDYSISYRGDRRALSSNNLARLRNRPSAFPRNEELLINATDILKDDFIDALYDLRI